MFFPKKLKFKKHQKGRLIGNVTNPKQTKLLFGAFGLKAKQNGYLTTMHLEIIRRILVKKSNKTVKIWCRLGARKILTLKAKDSRMGKGKGMFFCFVSPIKAGLILFEVDGISFQTFLEAFQIIRKKIPIKLSSIF